MDRAQALTVTPGAWSPAAADYLARALVNASPENLRRQVEAGAVLYYVHADGQLIGCYVLRIDHNSEGNEGVIVAAGGDHCGVDLVALLLPVMESQFSGVRAVRVHTSRPGMARKLAALGYAPQELVFSKVIQ